MEATHCQDIRSKLTLINVIVLVHLWASMSKLANKGPTGIWTQDLLFTRQALYQLSHRASPIPFVTLISKIINLLIFWTIPFILNNIYAAIDTKSTLMFLKKFVGFELRISCLLDRRFSQLSQKACQIHLLKIVSKIKQLIDFLNKIFHLQQHLCCNWYWIEMNISEKSLWRCLTSTSLTLHTLHSVFTHCSVWKQLIARTFVQSSR